MDVGESGRARSKGRTNKVPCYKQFDMLVPCGETNQNHVKRAGMEQLSTSKCRADYDGNVAQANVSAKTTSQASS